MQNYCTNCGTRLKEGFHYCNKCGHPVNIDEEQEAKEFTPEWSAEEAPGLSGMGSVYERLPEDERLPEGIQRSYIYNPIDKKKYIHTGGSAEGAEPVVIASNPGASAIEGELPPEFAMEEESESVPAPAESAAPAVKSHARIWYEAPSTWGYVGLIALLCVPVVNLVLAIVWACGGCKRLATRNMGIAFIIGILLFVIVCSLVLLIGGEDLFNDIWYFFEHLDVDGIKDIFEAARNMR